MNDPVCPYCRAPLDEPAASLTVCPVCGTPHHADCFEENGGCTVFGCSAAPPAEPKLSIAEPELHAPAAPATPAISHALPPPPLSTAPVLTAPLFSSAGYGVSAPIATSAVHTIREPDLLGLDTDSTARSRTAFLVLGALLGWAGAHSFYAGSTKKGLIQLGITLLTLGIAGLMVWMWAIIDICTITTDNDGVPFKT
jgi:TM2 domain-containing membrane protein YozV